MLPAGKKMEEINKPRLVCRDGRSDGRVKCVSSIARSAVRYPLRPLRRASRLSNVSSSQLLRVQEFDSRLSQTASDPQQAACDYCSRRITATAPSACTSALYEKHYRGGRMEYEEKTCCITTVTVKVT